VLLQFINPPAPNHGELVTGDLDSQNSPIEFGPKQQTIADQYSGFNLLYGTADQLFGFNNTTSKMVKSAIKSRSNYRDKSQLS